MSRLRTVCSLALVAALSSCGGSPAAPVTEEPASSASAAHPERPRLVIAVTVDHLPSWALERYLPHLSEHGIFRRAARDGIYHPRVELTHAATLTAPGHATLATGVEPAVHGISANMVYRRDLGKTVSSMLAGSVAGPETLRAPSIGDALAAATGGRGKVVSISLKDRGAIPAGGKKPDAVLWYDKKRGVFVTSSFYADSEPPWLQAWNATRDITHYLRDWEAADPELLERVAGCDRCPGEGDVGGLGVTFPHRIQATDAPLSRLRVTAHGVELQLDFAGHVAETLELGADEVPDLLHISVSSTDYVGHVFGAESWEYLDTLIRLDRELTELVDSLAGEAEVAVVISADHGAARLPERYRAEGREAGRVDRAALARELDAVVEHRLGDGPWVVDYEPPLVYLSAEAERPERREQVLRILLDHLRNKRQVEAAFEVGAPLPSGDPVARAAALSIPEDIEGDIFVILARHFVTNVSMAPGAGTSHGTPWDYDRHVPLLAWGAGVPPHRGGERVDQRQVAPSVSALLGVPAPSASRMPPAPGFPPLPR